MMKSQTFFKKLILLFTILTFCFNKTSAQKATLKGRVLEINSGKKPISFVQIKSTNGANSVLSNTNGDYQLIFQDQVPGSLVNIIAIKEGYEIVNENAMEISLPNSEETKKIQLEIILCEKGYLDKARVKYYKIANDYIRKTYSKRINAIIAKKEKGWQVQKEKLQNDKKRLKDQLKKQAEEYIRTNRDDLSEKELEALELFEAGKLDESLKVRASLNSEKELEKELKNQKRAKEKQNEAKKEKTMAIKTILFHQENLQKEANIYIKKSQFNKAEEILRDLVKLDTTSFNSIFTLAEFLQKQNKNKEAIATYQKALKQASEKKDIAITQNNLGLVYSKLNNYNLSLESFKEALKNYTFLAKTNPKQYEIEVVKSIINLGQLQRQFKLGKIKEISLQKAEKTLNRNSDLHSAKDLFPLLKSLQTYFSKLH